MKFRIRHILLGVLLLSQNIGVAQINTEDIDIVRDNWGVPHIFGKTDADVAYGLAWAMSEDDFKTVQEMLLAVRGRSGEVMGKNGAMLDFMGYILQLDDVVSDDFEKNFSPEYIKYVQAFADGLNRYAGTHEKEVLRKHLFPITSKDIIKSYTLTISLLTNVQLDIQRIFSRSIVLYERNMKYKGNLPKGSNAFAFSPKKTANGHTYLDINSHQPLEGLFSWYEAHLVSDEGMNILGGTFPGGASILHGVNQYLGWAETLNHPDLCDVYKLEMVKGEKRKYRFDGGVETLGSFKATVKVKVGPVRIPISRRFYTSRYGITLKNRDGFYSLRFPANMDLESSEQLWRMNKATSFNQFKEIMHQGHLAGTNTIYADREGNIFYISNGQFPYRNKEYDWHLVLPGNTSKTLWQPKFHPFTELPQYENPEAGYLFNTNGTPFVATAPEENLRSQDFDPTFGYQTEDKVNNRAIRAQQLISGFDRMTWDDFKKVKYDRRFNDSLKTFNINNIKLILHLDTVKYRDLKEAVQVIRDWDHVADVDDKEAPLLIFTFNNLAKILMSKGQEYESNELTEQQYATALRQASRHMKRHFGSLRVRLGDVQKHVRGDKVIGVGGAPDVIAAIMDQPYKKGMLRTFAGDSYIMLVDFDRNGPRIETVNAYGASNRPDSPHYDDQMELWATQKTKHMTLDKKEIYGHAEKIYHPQ